MSSSFSGPEMPSPTQDNVDNNIHTAVEQVDDSSNTEQPSTTSTSQDPQEA